MTKEKKFRVALAFTGLSQAEFARRIGKDASTVSRAVRGKSKAGPTMKAIDAFIAEHLDPSKLQKAA